MTNKSKIIALIGPPASGKTTLSLNLVTQLKVKGKNSQLIVEYPRTYIERFGHPQHISEQMLIFLNWNRLLNQAISIGYEYIVCDNPVFCAYIYGLMRADTSSSKDRMWILELLDMALESVKMYNKIFYIKPGKEFELRDNLRHSDRRIQKSIDSKIRGFLDLYKVNYEEIENKDLKKTTDEILRRI